MSWGLGGALRSRGWRLKLCVGGVVGAGEEWGFGSWGDCGDSIAKVCSTRRSPACMLVSTMKQPVPVVVWDVRDSGDRCVVFAARGPARAIRGGRRVCFNRPGTEGQSPCH